MFYLIFKYRTTVSPCVVMNWDPLRFTPTEATWVEPCSCTEIILNLLKKIWESLVTDYQEIVHWTIFQKNYSAAGTRFLTAKQAWDNLESWFLVNIPNKWPRGASVLLTFLGCSLSHKGCFFGGFFFLYGRVKKNRSMLWNDKRQCCEI